MADQETKTGEGEGGGASDGAGGDRNPHLEKAVKDRDKLKGDLRARDTELADLRAKLAEHESEKEQRAADEERKKSDFAAIEKRYQSQIDKEAKEKAELLAWKEGRQRSDRETALLDGVLPLLGDGVSRTVVRGLMKVLGEGGYDIAPAEIAGKTAADAAEQVRNLAPDLFKPRSNGSPGAPGTNSTNRPAVEYDANGRKRDPEAVAIGASYSPRPRTQR